MNTVRRQYSKIRNFLFLLAMAAIATLLSCSEQAQEAHAPAKGESPPLIIGLVPEFNVIEQKQRYEPLADYLGRKLGMDVRTLVLERYGGIVDAFTAGDINAAFHGSFGFVLLDSLIGIKPVARPQWKDGTSTYSGYIVTRKDSALTADIGSWKGKRMALIHKTTTAGYFFPLSLLRSRGEKELDQFFGAVSYTGSHEAAAMAVFHQEADLGALKNEVFDKLAKDNPAFRRDMVILAESAAVPSNTLSVRGDADPELILRLKSVLAGMEHDPEGKAILEAFGATRFIDTQPADFSPVVRMVEEAGYVITRDGR